MSFYEDIAEHYDEIFPASEATLRFLSTAIGKERKKVLDIACGTGTYSLKLAEEGYLVSGIDLDGAMIDSANKKNTLTNNPVTFLKEDMTKTLERFGNNSFDATFCIGNSLVHLNSKQDILEFFKTMKLLLTKGGVFLFQIINYDRVINGNIKGLPNIVNESIPLKFERLYTHSKEKEKILFTTNLTVGEKCKVNQIWLTPLLYTDAISMLKEVGFSDIRAYGDFNGSVFDQETSYMLVIQAK